VDFGVCAVREGLEDSVGPLHCKTEAEAEAEAPVGIRWLAKASGDCMELQEICGLCVGWGQA
jgi:hypothetical protein